MSNLREVTLLFLIRKNAEKISEICLAMKKRGFGAGRWNGFGGKVEKGEGIEEAARRETREEACIEVGALLPVANIDFYFPPKPEFNQNVKVFFVEDWQGEPTETEEMRPQWFDVEAIPYKDMWPDDIFWLPEVIEGKRLEASFVFDDKDQVLEKKIKLV